MTKLDAIVKKEPVAPSETGAFRVTNLSKKASIGVARAPRDTIANEKKLEEKVMKLLNNMQVIS
jgi:hypothetical protein